ncbi:MAG: hypothetical protein OEY01_05865 [Desulfobulbaceae bacterium]|nr:hypothetical protein [Desulfobulbaceae bacterium]HIJ78636.1 hypothetical protein [Deltaproteobacteria bacterium]
MSSYSPNQSIGLLLVLLCCVLPQTITAAENGEPDFTIAKLQNSLLDHYNLELAGFIEARTGFRLQNDPYEKDASLAEARLQLDLARDLGWGLAKVKADLGHDLVTDEMIAELREMNLSFSPLDNADVKVGRQVLTWGTGDLLFINDLFPKDWESFFSGRDDEYLKAPSDAVKTSFFFEAANLDLVYVPEFNNSNYIDGSRISYWNNVLGRTAGRDYVFADEERNRVFSDCELAARLYKNIDGMEAALYGYYGFWKTPEGLDPGSMRLIYPRLAAYGASLRGTLLGGIGNLEAGYYDSLDDQGGDNALIRNSEFRFLAGYERELADNLTGGFQYYLEVITNYDEYRAALTPGTPQADEYRHLLTMRLTKLMLNQNLRLSLFAYYSPSDKDTYLRPKAHYKVSDHWAIEAGGNLFAGSDDHTFFGQFDRNTNIYAGARYNF